MSIGSDGIMTIDLKTEEGLEDIRSIKKMNFRIIENPDNDFDLEAVIKDYQNWDIPTSEIKEKYQITSRKYKQVIAEIKDRGIPLRPRLPLHCKYYYYKKYDKKWVVKRVFDGKAYYFGYYRTEEEAEARVKELRENNWGGLL